MKTKEKIYKGQIDETWTEIDLTDFFKENPQFKNIHIEDENNDGDIDSV